MREEPLSLHVQMMVRKWAIILCFLLLGHNEFFAQSITTHKYSFPDREDLVRLSLDHLHHGTFDSVFMNCARLRKFYPKDPAGFLIEANACQVIMRDYRVRFLEARFDSLIKVTIKIAQNALAHDRIAENYFALGAAEGYLSFHSFRRGHWLAAVNAVRKSISMLKRASETRREFVDPLLGLALFEYGKFKTGIPFWGDLDEAVSKLKKVKDKGRYVSIDAMYALQMVYYEMERFEEALLINHDLYGKFPKNPVCLYNRALLFEEKGHIRDAISVWKDIIRRIENFKQPSNGFLTESHYHLAKLYQQVGEAMNSRAAIDAAWSHLLYYQAKAELDGPYTPMKKIRKLVISLRKKR